MHTPTDNAPNSWSGFFASKLSGPLGWAFALLLILMVALIAHAVWHIATLESEVRNIVEVLNRKIQLATDLQEAALNRYSALVYQTLLDDPFERDESFQRFIKWGYHVGKARNDLKAMPLDAFERDNVAQQDDLIKRISALHDEVADLAARGQGVQAQARIASDLRPLHLQFVNVVERLRHHARDRIRDGLLSTQNATRQAIRLHLILGGILLILAALTGLSVRRRLARHAATISQQMSELEAVSNRLAHEATHDPLTGLANRALFQRRLAEALAHARQDEFLLGVMYLDLDAFKPVNDTYGHAVGDALLKEIAKRMRQVLRVSDTVARLGGDEFAIVLTGLEGPDQCNTLRHKIEAAIAQPVVLDGVTLTPHASVGCVLYPRDGKTLDELLKAADDHMYRIKRTRKEDRAT